MKFLKYWTAKKGFGHVHPGRKKKARDVKRTPGKTERFVKGTGRQIWVGKDITNSGWISKEKFKEMLK